MNPSYWHQIASYTLNRRRFLGTVGSGAATTAFLAACSGSSNGGKSGGPTDSASLVAKSVDTTSQAKRGGKLVRDINADMPSLDPFSGGPIGAGLREFVWSRLFRYKPGHLESSQQVIAGDMADSWQWSPDGLTMTVKLRQGAKFHNIAPANGRVMDSGDLTYTWERFEATSVNRTLLANSTNPSAPILSLTAPDANSIVIKMKEPLVYTENFLGHRGLLNIIPKETKDMDLRQQMFGNGPYQLDKWTPSVEISFKRHDGYWEQPRPYMDSVDYKIISEYASKLAQFRAGTLLYAAINQSDVLNMKEQVPQLNLWQADVIEDDRTAIFGWQDPRLKDERVRQALSMSLDRDAWLDAQYNTDVFAKAGLPVVKRWHTSVECGDQFSGWWLDPQGKEFGANAKFFEHNPADAKKLLAAAGFPDGLDITSNHITTSENGTDYVQYVSLFESMATDAGFKFTKNIMTYDNYFKNIRTGQGKFSGISYKLGPVNPSGDAVGGLNYEYSPSGGVGFHGLPDSNGDPMLEAQLKNARTNFDTQARMKLIHDIQPYLAKMMYAIRWPGGASSFDLTWPALKNYRVFRAGDQQDTVTALSNWWIDDSQAPLVK